MTDARCANESRTDLAGKWCTCHRVEDRSHIFTHPVCDLIEHQLDDDGDCICGPTVQLIKDPAGDDAWHIIHHALDGRE